MDTSFQSDIDAVVQRLPYTAIHGPVHSLRIGEGPSQARTLKMLLEGPEKLSGNSVHVGVAGFFNFDIAVRTRPSHLLLLDANPGQKPFWHEVVRLLKENTTPDDFKAAFMHSIELQRDKQCFGPEKVHLRSVSHADYFQQAPWLNDPESYRYLRDMACASRIAATEVNLVQDRDRLLALRDVLHRAGLEIDTAYWSNIAEFLQPHAEDMISTTEGPFGSQPEGLSYPMGGYNSRTFEERRWDGRSEPVPPLEHMLRNISEFGGKNTCHIMLSSNEMYPPIFSEGPLRNVARHQLREQQVGNAFLSAARI